MFRIMIGKTISNQNYYIHIWKRNAAFYFRSSY